MLNSIIRFSLRNKFLIGIGTLCLLVLGIYETYKLPIDAQPDITNNQVQVITVAPSFSAADIERWVTIPIEQANSNIPGLEEIRSFNRFGLSLVTLVFTDDTDIYWARTQVTERLSRIEDQIPEGLGKPELGPISSGLGEIFQYVVRAKKGYEHRYGPTELRTIQDWVIRRQLLGTPGVAEVSSFGGKLKQYEIAISPSRLQAFQLSIQDIFQALENNNQNTGGAYIEKAETVLFIRSEGMVSHIKDLENLPVKYSGAGSPILLKDIAEIKIGHATRYGAMTYNDEGEVSGAIVMMLKGENANAVIKNIKARIKEIEKDIPEGVVIEPFLDRAKLVNNTISTIETNLAEGALIVVFILVLFLGNYRAGLLVASVIPLSMLFAIILMNLFGIGGNLMSLGALDFGLIVDGAVIIVEAVLHQMNKRGDEEKDKQVFNSASKMVNSAVFGQIIILVVYLPIFTLKGIEGKMFIPMAQTVAFALIGAFILSLTYIPAMSALVLKPTPTGSLSDRMMHKIEAVHHNALQKALKHGNTILLVVFLLFAGAVFTLSRLGGEFIPTLEEGDFAVEMRILPGSNIQTTINETNKAAKILKEQFPEVEKVVTKIGSAEIPTEPLPMDAGDMIVSLKPKKEWTSASSFPELSEKMSKALSAIPGLSTGFQFPVQMRFNELMTGARQDVVCKIFGENLDELNRYANLLSKEIQKVKGAEDLYIEPLIGAPQLVISYDRQALSRYKLSVSEVNKVVNSAFAGQHAGVFYEGERRFDIVVRLASEERKEVQDIKNLLVPTALGMQVPLHQLANIAYKSSPNQIQRENTHRRIIVGFNVRGRDVQSVVNELQDNVSKNLHLGTGYKITYGGTFENLNEARTRLGLAVPVSLALIFFLLYLSFKSFRYSLLIYTAIPLSATGGVYFLALRGMPFSISAGIGFIALFGVAVLNGIVLVAEYNRIRKPKTAEETVLDGTRVRLRPVLMTALVASLGFLPMALSKGSGAEVQKPLATVVIGGLLFATFLTLFVLPILYVKIEHWKKLSPVATLLFLFLVPNVHAQISREEVIKEALISNPYLQSSALDIQHKSKLAEAYNEPYATQFTAEYGKYNGLKNDRNLGVSQRFKLPTVHQTRKQLLESGVILSQRKAELTQAQIVKEINLVFQNHLVLEAQQKLFQKSDSLYENLERFLQEQLKQGEMDPAEGNSFLLLRQEIRQLLHEIESEKNQAQLELQWLVPTLGTIKPEGDLKLPLPALMYEGSHLELAALDQEIAISKSSIQMEKNALLPEFSLGYANQTLKDLGSGTFSSIQATIEIPIFRQSQKKRIEAAGIQTQMIEYQKQIRTTQIRKEIALESQRCHSLDKTLLEIENIYLPKAEDLEKMIFNKLKWGEISFQEYVIMHRQILDLRRNYFQTLIQRNQSASQLIFLNTNS